LTIFLVDGLSPTNLISGPIEVRKVLKYIQDLRGCEHWLM